MTPGGPEPRSPSASPTASATKEVVTLAWPIAAALLGETAIGLVDTKLVGGLGANALAGGGLGQTLAYVIYALVFGIMRGVKIATSHAIGEGRGGDGFAYARAGVVIGVVCGALQLLFSRDATLLLRGLGTEPEIVPFARDFLAAVTLGAPGMCARSALIQHRQAIGDTRTPMLSGIAANALNAVLAWALIYGHLGMPALGVRGAGYATALTYTLDALVLYALLRRLDRGSRERALLSPRRAVREVLGIGGPTGAQFFLEMLAFSTFTAVLSGIAAAEVAAHQVALAVLRVSFLPGVAVSEATSVIVGRSLGARRLEAADEATRVGLRLAVGFMAACGVLFAAFGGAIAGFFAADAETVAIARRLLLVAALFQVLDAVNIVLRGALRGAKDVRAVMLIGAAASWLCIPTSALLLGKYAGLGALGGWLGFVGETALAAALFRRRWRRGAWRADYAAPAALGT